MPEPLDELYLRWLYGQVASVNLKNPAWTYWSLLRQLYTKQYIWFIPNDDNRMEDGRDLRYEFANQNQLELDEEWSRLGCSILEMLIGLSRRLSFEADGEARDWFWQLITNLDLRSTSDADYKSYPDTFVLVDSALERLIWRTYRADGRGGLFPLKRPREDQTKVEVWYQMSRYLSQR